MAHERRVLPLSKPGSTMFLRFPAPSRPVFFSPEETLMNLQTVFPAILIVDDDPDILTALYDLLEHDGFRVIGVSTCRNALAQVKTADFVAVLIDIELTDGDGLAVLEQSRQSRLHSPSLFSPTLHHKPTVRGHCPAVLSPASSNHTIAMSRVPYYARPLGWADHSLLSITDAVWMMSFHYSSAHSLERRIHQPAGPCPPPRQPLYKSFSCLNYPLDQLDKMDKTKATSN